MKVNLSIEGVTPEDLVSLSRFLDEMNVTCHDGAGDAGAALPTTASFGPGEGKADGATIPPDSSISDGVQTEGVTPPPPPPAGEQEQPPGEGQQSAGDDTRQHDTNAETDADGFPWDERIHAGSRVKNKGDGKWRRRKNVDPALVEQVEAELRAAGWGTPDNGQNEQAGGGNEGAAPPPPPPTGNQQQSDGSTLPPPPPAGKKMPTFAEALPIIHERIRKSELQQSTVDQAFEQVGISAYPQLCALDAETWARFIRIVLPDMAE